MSDNKIQTISFKYIFIAGAMLFILSTTAYLYNFWVTEYPGNNYFSILLFMPSVMIAITYVWYELYWGSLKWPKRFILESMLYLGVAVILTVASIAAQYTPFSPIDNTLIAIERLCHIDLELIINWTNHHPALQRALMSNYDSIYLELYLIPIGVLIVHRYAYVREFCFLLLVTYIIGIIFYYVFPTTGPASILKQASFLDVQYATGLKFWQIHHHIQPSTSDGGLISMPSFHIIWAWLCTYMVRFNRPFFYFLLFYNAFMTIACVLLGWHYPIDIIGTVITLSLAHWIYGFSMKHFKAKSLPSN